MTINLRTMNICRSRTLQRQLSSCHKLWCFDVSKIRFSSQYSSNKSDGKQPAASTISDLTKVFKSAGISEPQLSAELLVGEVIGERNLDKLKNVSNHSTLSAQQSEKLSVMSQCRLSNMPVQYILGYWDFRELRLKMKPPVFIPRSETEELVSIVLNHLHQIDNQNVINVLEIGCGSGAISLSLLKEYNHKSNYLRILAIDQSASACNLSLENAAEVLLQQKESDSSYQEKDEPGLLNTIDIKNIKISGELSDHFGLGDKVRPNEIDVLISNPPYVLRKDLAQLDPQITLYEDLRALDGGKDGLQLIEKIILLGSVILKPNACIFLEIDPCHTFLLPPLLTEINEKILENRNKIVLESITKDFQGKDRFAILQKCIL